MPTWLRWAALLQGHNAPAEKFRYLDAGCGQGFNLILAAACHPESEFVGIDFMPEHIAHARQLADACALQNITFQEADFVELAASPASLGEFDYAVCHGITTWVAPVVKQALFKLLGHVLRPGGVFYNSYNTLPGWLPMLPFQHLDMLEQRSKPGPAALKAAQQTLLKLLPYAPALAKSLPSLQGRLERMAGQNTEYLLQEYNNQYWQPVFVSQMIEDLAAVKLNYMGTASLIDASDATLPPPVRDMLANHSSLVQREQLRDFAVNQSFRRDLYVKGFHKPWPGDLLRMQAKLRVQPGLHHMTRPAAGQPFVFSAGMVELQGSAQLYHGLLDEVVKHPGGISLGELAERHPLSGGTNLLQSISMLMHGGWVITQCQAPGLAAKPSAVNQVLARAALAGAPYKFAVAPLAGTAVSMSEVDWCLLQAHFEQVPPSQRAAAVLQALAGMGKALAHNGLPVADPAQGAEVLADRLSRFDTVTLPWLQQNGAA